MEAVSGKVCAALQAICIQCTGSIPDHLFIMVHGPVDNAGPADRKKPGFIIEILLKAFVLLWSDMVRGNIGKQAEIKADAAHPVEHHGLGGDFHDHMGAACVHHFCKIFLYQIGFRGGVGCGIFFRADDSPIGADEPHLFTGGLQDGLHHIAGGGLPLGPCDPDGHQLFGRIAESGCGKLRQGQTSVFHPEHRHIPGYRHILFCHQDPAALLQDIRDKGMGIPGAPSDADKYRMGPRLSGIVDHILHILVQASLYQGVRQSSKPVSDLHCPLSFCQVQKQAGSAVYGPGPRLFFLLLRIIL